jgi:truncated hemoglobin YjbI
LSTFSYPNYRTGDGYLTESTRNRYISSAVDSKLLPETAHRISDIVSLSAPNDPAKPIQFWQLHSVLGQDRIVKIVANFYQRVFKDEAWFRTVFERVGPENHHINTQAAMWLDVMGAGRFYHGGDFRLNFHHTHNAIQLMNEKGAKRWVKLMVEALDDSQDLMTSDPRVRVSINTFLSHFFGKYADEFNFENRETFGDTNPPFKRKINFLNMTIDAVETLSEAELKDGLIGRGIDVTQYRDKRDLVNKALSL